MHGGRQLKLRCQKLEKTLRSKKFKGQPELQIELCQLLCQLGEISRLKAHAHKALSQPKNSPQFVFQLVSILASAELHQEAYEALTQFLEKRPNSPMLVSQLARICDQLGKDQEGLAFFEGLSSEHQTDPMILLAKATLLRKSDQLQEALSLVEPLSKDESKSPSPEWSVQLWDQLFRIRDGMGEYKGAYQALAKRKEVNLRWIQPGLAAQLRVKKEESYQKMLQVIAALDRDRLPQWQEEDANALKAPAFLLGHPRSGTTLLENVLESNSKLVSSDERPSFQLHVIEAIQNGFRPTVDDETTPKLFCDYLHELPEKKRHQVRSQYYKEIHERLGLSPKDQETVILDKNPAITDGLIVINRLFPAGKIVFALRDPRAVAWSSFTLPMVGLSWIGSFWNTLEDAAIAWGYLWDIWEAYREKLPEDQFIEAHYENTVEDVKKQGKMVTEFLGLEWEDGQERFYEHAQSKVVRSPTYADVKKPIYSKAKDHWRNYEEHMGPAIKKLEPYLSKLGYD